MAVSAVMGALSAGTTALTGGTLIGGFLLGAGAAGTFLTHFLVSTAMGAALNALAPKPNLGSSRGYSLKGESGSALDHQIIYGKTKVGGVRIYDASTGTNNSFLHRILAFAGHRIESYEEIYLNDELLTLDGSGNVTSPSKYNGFVRIKQYLGTNNQLADPDLIADTTDLTDDTGRWKNDYKLSGIAYLYIRLKYSSDVFPNGIPAFSAVIKGKRVYNPATDTTAWSDNPALCLRDYLTTATGLNVSEDKISDTHVNAAATICDQTVDSEKRYTCNGVFTTGLLPKQIISDMTTSMGGILWYSGGLWKMKAAAYTTPTITLTEDDLRSGVSVSTRFSRRENFNAVKGTFRGEESDWQETDYPIVDDQSFLIADNNIENVIDFTLPFTSSSKTAQRLAKIFLFRNREQLTISASWGLRAFEVDVGDIVKVSLSRFGWVEKEFEVISWTFGLADEFDLQASMVLREISSQVFQDVSGKVFENNNTNLPSAFYVPSVGISLSSDLVTVNEHAVNVVYATITAEDAPAVEHVELQFKKSSSSVWRSGGTGDLGEYEIVDLEEVPYDFRARAYSFLGVKGEWFTISSYTPEGSSANPPVVQDFSAQLIGSSVNLSWTPSTAADLSYYRIRHSVDETGAIWSDASTYVDKVPRPATNITVPAKPGTYLIKAYDKTGHASESAASVVIPAVALETFTNTISKQYDPAFTGAKSNTTVISNTLRLTTVTGSPPFSGNYSTTNLANIIDTGAVRRFRARVDFDFTRLDNATSLFDGLSGKIDSLSGLWDDLTGGTQLEDVNVVAFISTTNDDPAGTPTWSAYEPIRVGDYYARAARFRLRLESNTVDVTPSVSFMKAYVQYN